MSAVTVPFWFKQRQAKAEEAGDHVVRVTGPNLAEGCIGIRKGEEGLWQAFLRQSADGPNLEATDAVFDKPESAWEAAFEIYRRRMVV